jgi:hypothetical protein
MMIRAASSPGTGTLSTPSRDGTPAEPDPGIQTGDHVSFHTVGARGILFDTATQKLYLLNRLGGFIWCCLAERMAPSEVAAELVRRSSTDPETAKASVRSAIAKWQAMGLMSDARLDAEPAQRAAEAMRSEPGKLEGRPAESRIRVCRVMDADFAILFWDAALETAVLPMVQAHLVDVSAGVTATLEVARGEGGSIALRHGAETMQVLNDPGTVAPAVFASLMKLALIYSRRYPALHAGAVRTEAGAILFPGASGAGKSTLMAGLLGAGYDVLADDTVVFDRESMRFRPLTPYLCVKEGSWETLLPRFPELMSRPDYHRVDRAHVRYLLAPGFSRGHNEGEDVRALVFPRYDARATTRLTRIAGFMALKELLPSIDPIGHKFTADDIDQLIGWMAHRACYTFTYPSLDEALEALRGVLK